ncbi:dTDP-4-dehydrorhamnose reductase [Sphingomonas gilva]|uniref:dTDP-4-dehydrorhamnose reductase n=1 Tax=Sphingomonas gilva TaxID=2305907 RepID=A0A396RST9_9SPHN|nr:dTDP-4-dehydrorhamnose reductase [Sphingomonas gilva]RHW16661.1 dTDP-4-dehydrorhamnose reductase [Sphingomonas gilva]
MHVLVTGREGQVARALAERAADRADLRLTFAARPAFDLQSDESVRRAVRAATPDVVIGAAAYTAVDAAEDDREAAFRCNGHAPGVLAAAAAEAGARIVHLSTDYVFDGRAAGFYREDAPTAPIGVYGASKLAGEEAVRAAAPDHVVLRTAWVHSPFGHNFVRTMLRLAGDRDVLRVVADQAGSPTSAFTIADGLLALIDRWRAGDDIAIGRTLNLAGSGEASWADFAREIMRLSAERGGPSATIEPIATADYPTRAARPANSRLDSGAFIRLTGYRPPDWREALRPIVRRLVR